MSSASSGVRLSTILVEPQACIPAIRRLTVERLRSYSAECSCAGLLSSFRAFLAERVCLRIGIYGA